MFDDSVFEALAHHTRGMATIFFVICTVITYSWRKRNRMTLLLFVAVSYVALGFIKDIIFVIPYFCDNLFVENLSSLFDVACTPLICAFFLETTRPRKVRNSAVVLSYLVFAAFIPIYCVFHSEKVVFGAFVLASLTAFYTMVLVPFYVVRYNKYLAENYSYTKDVGVNWIIACACTYFLWLTVYAFCFWESSWLGEAVFDIFCMIVLGSMCLLTRNHKVITNMLNGEDADAAAAAVQYVEKSNSADTADAPAQSAEDNRSRRDEFIAAALQKCMEQDKLYLNPLLSLNDLAMAAGTNKTYISAFINGRNKTFYDFVNEYRISEACRIMETSDERLSMADVATTSGFNSMSSFNRYFLKIKGVSPANYYRRLAAGFGSTEKNSVNGETNRVNPSKN